MLYLLGKGCNLTRETHDEIWSFSQHNDFHGVSSITRQVGVERERERESSGGKCKKK